jgi:hypothetical protein
MAIADNLTGTRRRRKQKEKETRESEEWCDRWRRREALRPLFFCLSLPRPNFKA